MSTLSLFGTIETDAPTTEGIKYAGSKLKLIPQILTLVSKANAKVVLDGFSGTTRVSQALARSGYTVVSNDIAVWSEVFGTCYLLNRNERRHYQQLIDHLNAVPPTDGWFTEHYGGDASSSQDHAPPHVLLRKYPWQRRNTRKLDAVREEIDRLSLPLVDRAVALTSLILAMDKVDSTIGHFASYLREWSPRSFNEAFLEIPQLFKNDKEHRIIRGSVFDVSRESVDLAYYDPPYGSNNEKMPPSRVRYSAYYHLWTSICLNDRPKLFGKAGRREDTSDVVAPSVFEEFRRNPENGRFLAVEAIERLIESTMAPWIILSYSSGGRATADELNQVISRHGRIAEVLEVDYKRNVMADMRWTNDWIRDAESPNTEFLFLIERR